MSMRDPYRPSRPRLQANWMRFYALSLPQPVARKLLCSVRERVSGRLEGEPKLRTIAPVDLVPRHKEFLGRNHRPRFSVLHLAVSSLRRTRAGFALHSRNIGDGGIRIAVWILD